MDGDADFWDGIARDLLAIEKRVAERNGIRSRVRDLPALPLALRPVIDEAIAYRNAALIREYEARPMPKGEGQ